MKWAEITIIVNPVAAETVASLIIEEGSRGTATISSSESAPDETRVIGYLPVDDLLEGRLLAQKERLMALKDMFGDGAGPLEISVRTIEEADWAEQWKVYYRPIRVGRIVVKPSWEDYRRRRGEIVIEIDPGMAFGTGQHPTTQLCLTALQRRVFIGCIVGDIGTGSGILAIAAAKLGARKVFAMDIDPVAVETAVRNVALNAVQSQVSVIQGHSLAFLPEPVDVLVANIVPEVIISLAPTVPAALRKGGIMISSGIVSERESSVIDCLESYDLLTMQIDRDADWIAIHSKYMDADSQEGPRGEAAR